jgi:hypothetical protein
MYEIYNLRRGLQLAVVIDGVYFVSPWLDESSVKRSHLFFLSSK